MIVLLFALPWIAVLVVSLLFRMPRKLPPASARPPDATPLVSAVVPARDEAANIETHVGSLMRSRCPRFEVIVVDDGSGDGTGSLARGSGRKNAEGLEVLEVALREAYERVGGHEAVRDEVGWSKKLSIGGLQSPPPRFRPFVPPVALLAGAALRLLPPVASALSLAKGPEEDALLARSGAACALGALTWTRSTARMGAPALYGLLYPFGAAAGARLFARSWAGGRRVEWKGRRYEVPPARRRP